MGGTLFFAARDIEAYADDGQCSPEQAEALSADLAAYQAVVVAVEEAAGIAELNRQAEEVQKTRSAVYENILEASTTTFDGLAEHIRFLIDEVAYPDEIKIILAGLETLRRVRTTDRFEPAVIGFGPAAPV